MTPSSRIPRASWRLLAASLPLALAACQDESPTSVGVDVLPPEPLTISIQLPWAEFGSDLAVYGGYAGRSGAPGPILARDYAADDLDSNVLLRLGPYPATASVRDAGGTIRQDTDLSFYGGYFVAYFNPVASTNTAAVELALGTIETPWHTPSAGWLLAIDTVANQQPWPEPGGGPVTPVTTGLWDPAAGDSAQFFLDSAQVAAWKEPGATEGLRIELLTAGERLQLANAALRLYTRSSINPDTILILTTQAVAATFVYDVDAAPPADGMRVGGAPAWRTVLDVAIPSVINGPPELCAAVGCPFALAPRHVSFASLKLRTRSPAVAFQPTDSIAIDVRPVLSRAALPKSPLGLSLIAGATGRTLAAPLFGAEEGTEVAVPITNYVRALLSDPDPAGRPAPTTLALLGAREPGSFAFAEFFGPGPNEPVLELILTVSRPLELR